MPPTTADSWRTWLITGTRLVPVDARRARGAHGRLRKALTEASSNGAERPHRWKDFTSAMDRQAVGEALNALPYQQRQLVKLAYFGGLTNREIADQLGVPVGGVRHRLRQALATASEYVERGRATGYKIAFGLVAWFYGRSLEATQRSSGAGLDILRASIVVAAGVTASVVLGVAQLPAQGAHIDRAGSPAVKAILASGVDSPKATTSAAAAALRPTLIDARDVPKVLGVPSLPVAVPVPGLPINVPGKVHVPAGPINIPIPSPAVPALPKLPI